MDTLKLQTNIPEVIALEFAEGLAVSSKFSGDQVMFTLVDGRRAYLAPFVAQKIVAAGIQPGELFEITKREVTHGNRRTVDFQIRTDLNAPPANGTPRQQNAALAASLKAPAPAGAAHPPAAALAPPTVEGAAAAAIKLAGKIAVDAVLEVEAYSRSKGMTDFAFGADNIQRVMVSLYIDLRKGGRA